MAETVCICPVVEIRAERGQVSDAQRRRIADDLNAQVSHVTPEGDGPSIIWGKHRSDCPCHWEGRVKLMANERNLYHVQDSDRPAWVVATNWQDALNKWKRAVAIENDDGTETEPQGIQLVCEDGELIIDNGFERPL